MFNQNMEGVSPMHPKKLVTRVPVVSLNGKETDSKDGLKSLQGGPLAKVKGPLTLDYLKCIIV